MKVLKVTALFAVLTIYGSVSAYAQGCGQGYVWCCKRTYSGTACSCTVFC